MRFPLLFAATLLLVGMDLHAAVQGVDPTSIAAAVGDTSEQEKTSGNEPVQDGAWSEILNVFLAAHCDEVPEWRKDIRAIGSKNVPPAQGFRCGFSQRIGWFHFRPALWSDLTPEQRGRVRRDPRMLAFLRMLRAQADGTLTYPSPSETTEAPLKPKGKPKTLARAELFDRLTNPNRVARVVTVDLAAVDLLSPEALHIAISPTMEAGTYTP